MIKLALPTGDLRAETATFLDRVGLAADGYGSGSRSYRFKAGQRQDVRVRVFREKDIPIQVALGNYDAGICGLAWVEELLCRFPSEAVVPLRDLGFGGSDLYLAAAGAVPEGSLTLASEFANLASAVALGLRLPSFRVLGLWGSAEAYPPEDADLALLAGDARRTPAGLQAVHTVLRSSAWLVANRRSLATTDLSALLQPLLAAGEGSSRRPGLSLPPSLDLPRRPPRARREDVVRIALPDGHQKKHAVAALAEAGIRLHEYADGDGHRPRGPEPWLEAKVIRPQDMPQQVALGRFDLAITGHDWVLDHWHAFPTSPVIESLDLGRGRYTMVATVSEDEPASTLAEALANWRRRGRPIRVASEYPNVADHFARERRLGRYQIIPIAGASEGFVPEDADILIEGTETGTTLAANRLKVIDRLFESTAVAITGPSSFLPGRRERVESLLARLRTGALAPAGGG